MKNDNLYNGPINGPQAGWSPDYKSEKPNPMFELGAMLGGKNDELITLKVENSRLQADAESNQRLLSIAESSINILKSEVKIEQQENAKLASELDAAKKELEETRTNNVSLKYQNNQLKYAEGWRCWHCDERFTTPGGASDHFGRSPEDKAGCLIKVGEERGLLMELRRTQDKLKANTAKAAAMQAVVEAARIAIKSFYKQYSYKEKHLIPECIAELNQAFEALRATEGQADE